MYFRDSCGRCQSAAEILIEWKRLRKCRSCNVDSFSWVSAFEKSDDKRIVHQPLLVSDLFRRDIVSIRLIRKPAILYAAGGGSHIRGTDRQAEATHWNWNLKIMAEASRIWQADRCSAVSDLSVSQTFPISIGPRKRRKRMTTFVNCLLVFVPRHIWEVSLSR